MAVQGLTDVPPEPEWFANLSTKATRRAYETALKNFIRFTGIERPEEFRTVTRAHIIAWRDELAGRSYRQRPSGTGCPPPARNSIIKRIRTLDAQLVACRRMGPKASEAIALSTPGTLEATQALELVQIDHTLADVIIVDSHYRRSIGRPWLSLAIDVATRSVLGFHVGLEAPSALAVALCIEHGVLPKPKPQVDAAEPLWEQFGLPQHIHVDNGPEFHGEALTRGCREYGIRLIHRPVARPRFGAHIERLIGTLMGRVHLLPGSTDSSPSKRAGYHSENEARLTLSEFTEWLVLDRRGL